MSSGWEHMQLLNFTEAELIFDEQETKEILKFFFQADRQQIESTQITNGLSSAPAFSSSSESCMLFLVIGYFLMVRLKCRNSHLTEVLR